MCCIDIEGDSARQTAGRSAGLNARQRRVADQGMIETSDQGLTATVTTSVPSQSHATVRHMGGYCELSLRCPVMLFKKRILVCSLVWK